jgi:hypothetical protein
MMFIESGIENSFAISQVIEGHRTNQNPTMLLQEEKKTTNATKMTTLGTIEWEKK